MTTADALAAMALVLLVILVALGLSLGYQFMTRTDFFMEAVFSKHRVTREVFFSPKQEDSDFLVLHYDGARVFVLVLFLLAAIWLVE